MISSTLCVKSFIFFLFFDSFLIYIVLFILLTLFKPKYMYNNYLSFLTQNSINFLLGGIYDFYFCWGLLTRPVFDEKKLRKKLSLNSDLKFIAYLSGYYFKFCYIDFIYLLNKELTFFKEFWEEPFEDFFFDNFDNLGFMLMRFNLPYFNFENFKYHSLYYYSKSKFILPFGGYFAFIDIFRENFDNVGKYKISILKHYTNKLFILRKNIFFLTIPFYSLFKSTLIPLSITVIFFFSFILYYYINIFKQLAIWLMIGFLFFWLISGFNFFLKNSHFGKFTSALSRFWKRTNVYFWLVEGFLFTLFFYYYLNSSQEPLYMYDYSNLNQTFLPNLYTTYSSNFLVVCLIIYVYFWLLSFSGFTAQQNIFHCLFITLTFVYIYFMESYQFYYILTIFFENLWIYNQETNLWVLEFESPRLRVKQQYLILALIAKYWHFIFIFLSWVFFAVKLFEQKRAYYTHTGFNLQNLIILFWLNFLFIVSWGKWITRRFLDSIYYWFFTDTNFHFMKYILNELIINWWR